MPGNVKRADRREAIEDLVRRADAGESMWDDDDEIVEVEVRVPLDKIIPVRLASEKWAALHHEAKELGIGPTTLARMWILEKLRAVQAERAPAPAWKAAPARKRAASARQRAASGKSRRSA